MPQDRASFLWEQYKHCIDLHRSYLDLVIKINVFYYAVTGAIISFYFYNSEDPLMRFSLVLPFLMSIALAIFFYRAASAADVTHSDIEKMATNLGFEVFSVIAAVLAFLLRIFFGLMVVSAIGIFILFFRDYFLG
jgi:hypothetical protein